MNHFFVKSSNIQGDSAIIEGEDVRHVTGSLRLEAGDQLTIADNQEDKYIAEIIDISEDLVQLKIMDKIDRRIEPKTKVTLVQGLPKSKKMDLIVQKCTELGIDKIIPVDTKRTIVNLKPSKAKRRQDRWQKIAKEAAKQSGRAKVPQIQELSNLDNLVESFLDYDLVVVPWEDEGNLGLKEILSKNRTARKILVIIGPEGGLAVEEVDKIKAARAYSVSLGPRILRTETAGIAALSMILYELDDLG